jgi:hypothetical protein
MAAPVLQFKRGLIANLPALKAGEPGFTTDGFDLFIGLDNNSGNNKFFGSHRYWTKETSSTGSSVKVVEGTTNGTHSIALKSPDTLAGDLTYTLPGIQGSVSSVLTNDGSGNLSWASGSANPVFTGIATFNTGQVDVNSTVTISGITTFESTADSTSKDTGALIVEGGVGIEKSVHIGAALSITTNLYVGGQSEFIGIVTFRGGTINLGDSGTDDVVIGGEFASDLIPTTNVLYNLGSSSKRWADIYARSVDLSGNLNVTGFSTFNGLVVGNNGVSVSGFSTIYDLHILSDLNVNGSFDVDQSFNASGNAVIAGITSFTNTTQSTNYDNGSVVLDGGLGVQKNVNIGGNLDVTGNITIGGSFFSVQSQEVYISNKDIILGYTTSITPNDDTANHAGVAIASTIGSPLVSFVASGINTLPDTYKQLMWFKSGTLGFATDAFAFNYALAIGTTSMANGVRLAVGTGVTISDTAVSATNFYGSFSGNASSANQVKTVTASDNNATYHITFVDANNGSATNETVYTDDGIYYNPGTNTFTTQNANFTNNVTVQGTLTGTATTATNANLINITTQTSDDSTYYIPFESGIGYTSLNVDTALYYNPGQNTLSVSNLTVTNINASGIITATTFVGAVTGTASTATTVNTTATSTNADYYVTFVDTFAGQNGETLRVGAGLSVNPSTGEVKTTGDITIGGNDIKASDGTTAITLTATTGAVGVSSNLTVSGNLYVLGSTTEVNTETLKVEDSLIEVGLVNSGGSLVPPSSDLNIDVGVLFHYYTSSAKKAGVYWDDSASRVVISSDLSESSSVITSSTYAALEIGSLWVTDCAGTSQVINCSGSTRTLENITVDGGAF